MIRLFCRGPGADLQADRLRGDARGVVQPRRALGARPRAVDAASGARGHRVRAALINHRATSRCYANRGGLHRFPSCQGKALCKKGEEFQAKQEILSPLRLPVPPRPRRCFITVFRPQATDVFQESDPVFQNRAKQVHALSFKPPGTAAPAMGIVTRPRVARDRKPGRE